MLLGRPHSPDVSRGLWDRGDPESVPPGYLSESFNLVHSDRAVSGRPGSRKTSFRATGPVSGLFLHRPLAGAGHVLALDSGGSLHDTSVEGSPPIAFYPGANGFVARSMHGRSYVCFLRDGRALAGDPGGLLHVYDGDPLLGLRLAGGAKPAGPPLAVVAHGPGRIEPGLRKWCVAYRTRSGHVTVPALFFTTNFAQPSAALVGGLPVGPPDTAARVLYATKRILDPNHLDESFEYFLVKTVENNVDVATAASFYDSELLSSANRRFQQLERIPGGPALGTYAGRLVVGGSAANPNRCWISDAGYPERFDSVTGIVDARPDEGEELVCAAEYRDRLYLGKRRSFLFLQSVGGQEPVGWPVLAADHGIGSTVHGIAGVLDRQGGTLDRLLVVSEKGLLAFDGTFRENLAYAVESLWTRIDRTRLHEAQALVDPVQERVYCLLPIHPETVQVTDSFALWDIAGFAWGPPDGFWGYDLTNPQRTNESLVLVADYRNGLSPETVRWSVWTFPESVSAIMVRAEDRDRERLSVSQGTAVAEVRPDAENDSGERVEASFLTAYLQRDRWTLVATELVPRVLGSARHAVVMDGGFDGRVEIERDAAGGRYTRRVPANYSGERMRFGIKSLSATGTWELRSLHVQIATDGHGMPS